MGGVRHRYHSPLSRCIYLGRPTERMNKVASVIAEGLNAVLDKVKPGVTCEELAATWKAVISRHGIEKDNRIGYPVGIGYPADLGRAHRQHPRRRQDGAGGRHDFPLHPGDLARHVRARDLRDASR